MNSQSQTAHPAHRNATPEEKTRALELVLQSEAFARADQLRTFLRYICEREIAGRVHEISEYTVGVEVLGRPEGYSSVEDSSVRKRAYELRQRLDRVYASELNDAPVRIEIPKGSYVPRFIVQDAPADPELRAGGAETPVPARPGKVWLVAAAAAALSFVAGWFIRPVLWPATTIPPVLEQAWGPMAKPGADVLVCVATNLHLIVRPYAEKQGARKYEAFPELYELFRKHRPLPEGTALTMLPADASVTFGEVWATVLAGSMLRSFGASHQILPEGVAPYATLRNRNAVVIGVPMDSVLVSRLLSDTPYTLEYDPAAGDQAVLDRRRAGNRLAYQADRGVAYGLLTVLPSDGAVDERKETVVFSGIGSVGAQAAAEFFSSPSQMTGLRERFRTEGVAGFPRAYQVVVKCRASEGLLVSYEYSAHVIITR